MKNIIPFTKELAFNTKVSEITSISLEKECEIKDNMISGNLLITGEYKSHEISVNVNPYSFKIPFDIDLPTNTILDTVKLEINDFAYDMISDDKIKVMIELGLELEKEEQEEVNIKEEENVLLDNFIDVDVTKEVKEERDYVESVEEKEQMPNINEEIKVIEVEKENFLKIDNTEEEYLTYHIHILKEGENLETLCNMYNVSASYIENYNDLNNLSEGNKILIPFDNE